MLHSPAYIIVAGRVSRFYFLTIAHRTKKIQMQEEYIVVHLYNGYAAVKGQYIMKNTTDEAVNLHMGYPINSVYTSNNYPDLQEMFFDSLSAFKVEENGKAIPLAKQSGEELDYMNKNWLVWESAFQPNESKTFEVYFIVNTNGAEVRHGYNVEDKNVFIYLFESGSTWKQPIEQATLHVQLMDNLSIDDVLGLRNPFILNADFSQHLLYGTTQNFEPKQGDNLIIAYGKTIQNFNFQEVVNNKETIFNSLNQTTLAEVNQEALESISFENPFDVKATVGGSLPYLITMLFIVGPFILMGIFIAIIAYYMYKRYKLTHKK
ncbi:MAG: hypothetical protein LRY27_02115 [Chitinophagales bacterium]|nr:hypothetical protein [Chitinophagales bacterium]